MHLLIVVPAHNEEKNIFFCLESLRSQSYRDFSVVVVDDGSTDRTSQIVSEFCGQNSNFKLINLEKSTHEPGAKVVRSFNAGLSEVHGSNYDIVCKFDADIIFPQNYLAEIKKVYMENPKAGMVSGIVKVKKSIFEKSLAYDFKDDKKQWIFEDISSKNHVRGPIKSYRKACFEQMNGLRPVLGWDNIDVMLSKMNGWEVVTIKNLWVKHLRPTAYKYKNQKAEKLGQYFYNIGLNAPLATISAGKSALKNKSVSEFFGIMKSFFGQSDTRKLSNDEIRYIRKLRWQQIFNKAKP